MSFWAERLREARYDLNEEELRPYFALPSVLEGLFQVGGSRSRSGRGLHKEELHLEGPLPGKLRGEMWVQMWVRSEVRSGI